MNNVTNNNKSKDCSRKYGSYFTTNGFRSLRTYLGNVRKGQNKVFKAPFAKGQEMSTVLADWDVQLVSIANEWPSLYEFEKDLANKVGPMSVQKPLIHRMDDIEAYYADISLPANPIDDAAINAVIKEWSRLQGLRLRSQKETVANMKLSSNSGGPFFTKRRNVVQDTFPCECDYDVHFETKYAGSAVSQSINSNEMAVWDGAAVLGWRGQEGGSDESDVKQRVVWMFPFAVNICELQAYQPLIQGAQRLGIVPPWISNDAVDKEITKLFDTKSPDDLIVCTDFTKFDQHFNVELQDAAKTVLAALLTPGMSSQRWLDLVYPIKYHIPLIYDYSKWDVKLKYGPHGMASGSGGTNFDETIAHRALQYEAALQSGSALNPHSMCLGDDGILSYPGITVEAVVNAYQSHGQECNVDKQYASTQDCTFLRRWHHNDYRIDGVCVGVYSTNRALGRLRYLERFMDPDVWSPTMVALRQLSIIENCKWHPLFHQFVDFCMARDKYRLGIDIPGFFDNLKSHVKEATDYMPDFLGYTKTLQGDDASGILDWKVVQYLKSKA